MGFMGGQITSKKRFYDFVLEDVFIFALINIWQIKDFL